MFDINLFLLYTFKFFFSRYLQFGLKVLYLSILRENLNKKQCFGNFLSGILIFHIRHQFLFRHSNALGHSTLLDHPSHGMFSLIHLLINPCSFIIILLYPHHHPLIIIPKMIRFSDDQLINTTSGPLLSWLPTNTSLPCPHYLPPALLVY